MIMHETENLIAFLSTAPFTLPFSKPMFPLFLRLSKTKVLDPNAGVRKKENVCLLAIVIVVVCRQPISAYADAKIFNKNTVFCSKLSLRGWTLIFVTVHLDRLETLPYV